MGTRHLSDDSAATVEAVIESADLATGELTPAPDSSPVGNPSAFWRLRGYTLMVFDFVAVVAGLMIAYYLRFHLHVLEVTVSFEQNVVSYLKGAVLLALIWTFLIWRDGGYEGGLRGIARPIIRIRSLLVAGVKALAMLMIISFMYRRMLLSRTVYLMSGLIAGSMMVLGRLLVRELDRDLAGQGVICARVLVVGLSEQSAEFARRIKETGGTVRMAGFVATHESILPEQFDGHPVIGRLDNIADIFGRRPFEKLVLSSAAVGRLANETDKSRLIEVVNFCEAHDVSLYTLPNVLNIAVNQNDVGAFSGIPLVKMRDAALHPGYAVLKRIMDIAIAGTVLLVGMPIWAFIAASIKWSNKGPVLFTQVRAGLHGRPFRMYKFRSMVQNADAKLRELVDLDNSTEPVFNIRGRRDPRITPIGKWLRRTSLDEIPQLINVLKGEMSLVGPRPERVELVNRYNHWQRRRLKAKPGITGLQQVVSRGDPSLAVRIKYDLVYLKQQSLLLDLYIIGKTFVVVFRGSGVMH